MLINLSDVLTTEGMQISREVMLEMPCFSQGAQSYEILSKSPVTFVFTNTGEGKARLEGKVSLKVQGACDRCLTPVPVELNLDFGQQEISFQTGLEEGYMEGSCLDTEAFVHNEILVSWPGKILCREDCRGICPVCGRDLNKGDCGCDTFVPDPRMAVIQDIFHADKEV